jgi:hypothetical protein
MYKGRELIILRKRTVLAAGDAKLKIKINPSFPLLLCSLANEKVDKYGSFADIVTINKDKYSEIIFNK